MFVRLITNCTHIDTIKTGALHQFTCLCVSAIGSLERAPFHSIGARLRGGVVCDPFRRQTSQTSTSPSFSGWGKSSSPVEATMSDCRRQWNREDELPVYLAGPISTGPNQRKSYGMFSSVEGAFESKTIDFDNYAVGRKGSRTPRSGSRERLLDSGEPIIGKTPSDAPEGSLINSPGERDDGRPGVETIHSSGKESQDGKVG